MSLDICLGFIYFILRYIGIYTMLVFLKTTSALSTYCMSLLLFLLLLPSSVSQVFPLYLRSWLCLTIFCPLFCHLSPTCFWSFSHSPSFHPRWTLWIFKYTYRRGRSSALQGLHNPATPVHLYSHWSFGKAEKDSRQFLALYSADGNSWNQDFACSCPISAEAAWAVFLRDQAWFFSRLHLCVYESRIWSIIA